MILGTPAALWWLLLIPLVILLYMLRARREPRVVPSTLLWERATRDLVARMPVRRLERSLLLLLQVLAIAAVVLALARPSLLMPGVVGDATVVVLQTTASMQATDESPSRFAVAQQEAAAFLSRLGPRQLVALVEAGHRATLVTDFTTDRAAVTTALQSLRATDASGSIAEAVALAGSLRAAGRPARVHVFGDRIVPDRRAQWHPIGHGAVNVAIAAASARPDVTGSRLLVRLEAFGGTPPPRRLVVTLEGRTLADREVRPGPGMPQVVVLDLGRVSGMVTAQLQGSDALPADDRAVVAVGQEALPRALVLGGPNPVLDTVLRVVPLAAATRTDRVVPSEWGRADLVVLDGLQPLALPPGAYLLIGTLGENLPGQIEGTVQDQVIRTVRTTHPVMRLVDLRGVRVATAVSLKLQGGTVLAEGDGPLLWAYEGRGLRVVLLPFALDQTDLPLHPSFPVLIANAVGWLAGESQAAAGDTPVVAAGPWRSALLADPQGRVVELEAREGQFLLPPLDRVGAYRLRSGGWERRWVVSTVDARESDLAVAAPSPSAAAEGPQTAQVSLVAWLLGLAALVVAGEWMLWARTVPPGRALRGAR